MDFSLSEEQQLLRDSVERFVRESYSPEQRRKLIDSEAGFSEAHWQRMAELGWLGVSVPEELGGIGGGPVEVMVLMEAFGAGLVLEPYLSSVVLGGALVQAAGSQQQQEAILPALIAGSHKLAFAYVEAQAGYDLFDVETTAVARDGGFVLDGAKGVVLGAPAADALIVSARTAGASRDRQGIGLFLVPREAAGVALRSYRTMDGLRAAEVRLDHVQVAGDAALGDPEGALPIMERVADSATAALCAEAVGAMDVLVDATNEYLQAREQFGRPIASFQALQHQLVDMLIAREEARSIMYVATLRLAEEDAGERAKAVSAAKHLIGRHGLMVGERSVQLHGGMGMCDEMQVGHFFKRLAMIDIMLGDHAWHLKRYARL